MKIVSAEFVTSADASAAGVPRDARPHLALAGRSNVGKSSLINALARRNIARTSAAPGKTRLPNIYRVELEGAAGPGRFALYFVDLPGYGYARGGAEAAAELKAATESYFLSRDSRFGIRDPKKVHSGSSEPRVPSPEPRRAALLLIDSRHPGLDADVQALRWLRSIGVDTHLVATKVDKLTRSERARHLKAIGDTFGMAALPVSVASGEGLDELWRMIVRIVTDADRHE